MAPDARPRVVLTTEPVALMRWRARAPRIALAATVGLFALIGLRTAIAGPPNPVAPARTPAHAGDPSDAEGVAQAFARAWLTVDPSNPDAHARAVKPFLGSDVDADAGLSPGRVAATRVVWTAVVGDVPTRSDMRLVTVGLALDHDPALRYVAVPVVRAGDRLVVDAYPALVGPPRLAGDYQAPEQDDVTDTGLALVVRRALGNYLRGSAQDLAADLDRGVTLTTPAERLSLQSVDSLTWAGPARVDAQIVARAAGGTTYTLRYELAVARRDRWYVRGLNPAAWTAAEKGVTK